MTTFVERPFLAKGPTFQYIIELVIQDHIFVANRVVLTGLSRQVLLP